MSDTHRPDPQPEENELQHASHTYQLLLCDEMKWTAQVDPAVVPVLKIRLREKLRDLLAPAGPCWSHDLDEIARRYGIRSLHEIPERVHRELIQCWLDRINATRDPYEGLCMSTFSSECCYRPPHLWYACTKSRLLVCTDPKNPCQFEIEVSDGNIRQRIPITIGAGWTCEITPDGKPQPDATLGTAQARA
jgi:hypothetical protein